MSTPVDPCAPRPLWLRRYPAPDEQIEAEANVDAAAVVDGGGDFGDGKSSATRVPVSHPNRVLTSDEARILLRALSVCDFLRCFGGNNDFALPRGSASGGDGALTIDNVMGLVHARYGSNDNDNAADEHTSLFVSLVAGLTRAALVPAFESFDWRSDRYVSFLEQWPPFWPEVTRRVLLATGGSAAQAVAMALTTRNNDGDGERGGSIEALSPAHRISALEALCGHAAGSETARAAIEALATAREAQKSKWAAEDKERREKAHAAHATTAKEAAETQNALAATAARLAAEAAAVAATAAASGDTLFAARATQALARARANEASQQRMSEHAERRLLVGKAMARDAEDKAVVERMRAAELRMLDHRGEPIGSDRNRREYFYHPADPCRVYSRECSAGHEATHDAQHVVGVFDSRADVIALMATLDVRGTREGALHVALALVCDVMTRKAEELGEEEEEAGRKTDRARGQRRRVDVEKTWTGGARLCVAGTHTETSAAAALESAVAKLAKHALARDWRGEHRAWMPVLRRAVGDPQSAATLLLEMEAAMHAAAEHDNEHDNENENENENDVPGTAARGGDGETFALDDFEDFREAARDEGVGVGDEGSLWDVAAERNAWRTEVAAAMTFSALGFYTSILLSHAHEAGT